MSLQTGCQVRRYRMLVQIRKDHILRFVDIRKLIDKSRIRCGHRRRTADGRLIVARIIAGLSHGFHNERRHIGFADIRIGAGNK